MEKDIIKDFPKLIEDVFDEFEAANNLYEPETGKTFMAHADFAEIVGKKYNMPDNELDSLLMIIVDNQMKDKNRPYMVSRDTFKQGSNVAQSVQDYVNGNPVTIEKSFTDQQQTMFEGTYQRKLPDTPTNVVDDIPEEVVIGIDRSGKEATVLVNENGYVELFRATDNPERLVISDFIKQGDIQSAGLGTQNYFATNAPYANKYTGTNKKLYKFSTNIKPNEILDISPVSLKNKHPKLYTLIFGKNEIRNTKAIQDNIETIKELGYKAIGNRETGSTGLLEVAQYEIIPLTTANETYNIKPIATLQTKEGFAAGKSPEAFIETSLDTPTNIVDETTNIYDVNEIENYANGNQRITPDQVTELEALTNTYKDQANNIVNKLPLEDTVKKKLRNKLSQMSVKWTTFSGAGELLDIYETGVLLFYGLVAAKPELEKIASNYMIDMYNTMAEPYGAKINREEYTPNWENINEQLTKAEKITPTDIIIKKTKELAKDTGETGMVTGFGYVPTTKDKLNKTLAYPKPVEADVVDPMYDRIKRTFSGKFV
jgi:hypothetical protein